MDKFFSLLSYNKHLTNRKNQIPASAGMTIERLGMTWGNAGMTWGNVGMTIESLGMTWGNVGMTPPHPIILDSTA
jgi:hypothetical protein